MGTMNIEEFSVLNLFLCFLGVSLLTMLGTIASFSLGAFVVYRTKRESHEPLFTQGVNAGSASVAYDEEDKLNDQLNRLFDPGLRSADQFRVANRPGSVHGEVMQVDEDPAAAVDEMVARENERFMRQNNPLNKVGGE